MPVHPRVTTITKESFQGRNVAQYDPSPEDTKRMCEEFLSSLEHGIEGRFGCFLLPGNDAFSNLGRAVESKVFEETFSNGPEIMEREYGPYDQNSVFFVGIDQEAGIPIASMRVILPSENGLKTLNDLQFTPLELTPEDVYGAYNINPAECLDVATVAVLEDYRGDEADNFPSLLMYRSLYAHFIANPRFSHAVTIMDVGAKKSIDKYMIPFKPILDTEPFSYLDSPKSAALIGQTSEFYPQVRYWQQKFDKEGQAEQDRRKQSLAGVMKMLMDGDFIDSLLASEITVRK
jgi:hypothetical protein